MPGHCMMFHEHVEPVEIATNSKENIRMLILVTLKSFSKGIIENVSVFNHIINCTDDESD